MYVHIFLRATVPIVSKKSFYALCVMYVSSKICHVCLFNGKIGITLISKMFNGIILKNNADHILAHNFSDVHTPQPKSDDIFKFNWCYAVVYQMHHDLDS